MAASMIPTMLLPIKKRFTMEHNEEMRIYITSC